MKPLANVLHGECLKARGLLSVRLTILLSVMGIAAFVSLTAGRYTHASGLPATGLSILTLERARVVPVLLGAWIFGQDSRSGPYRRLLLTTPRHRLIWWAKSLVTIVMALVSGVAVVSAAFVPLILLGLATMADVELVLLQLATVGISWPVLALITGVSVLALRTILGVVTPLLIWMLGLSQLVTAQVPALKWMFDQVLAPAAPAEHSSLVLRAAVAVAQAAVISASTEILFRRHDAG